jgi:hypothetical protein
MTVEYDFASLVSSAFDDVDHRKCFSDKVVSAFGALVWSVHTHPHATPELLPASGAAVSVMAERLRRTAEDSGARVNDPTALADILIRLAHAVLLVPDSSRPLTTRADVDGYARRHVAPLTGIAATAAPPGEVTPRRRRTGARMEILAAALVAVVLGAAGLVAMLAQPTSGPVTPTDMTGVSTTAVPPPPIPSPPQAPAAPADPPAAVVVEKPTPTTPRRIPPPPPPPTAAPPAVAADRAPDGEDLRGTGDGGRAPSPPRRPVHAPPPPRMSPGAPQPGPHHDGPPGGADRGPGPDGPHRAGDRG